MLAFALISPLRVVSSDWEKFSKHVSKSLKGPGKPLELSDEWTFVEGRDYKYHPLEPEKLLHGNPFEATFHDSLTSALSRVRKAAFAVRQLEDSSLLLLFSTGEACVIELHTVEPDQALTAIPTTRKKSPELVAKAAEFLTELAQVSKIRFELGETITHTILVLSLIHI